MPASPLVQALLGLTALACLLAFWRGGAAERWAGAIIALNVALGAAAAAMLPHDVEFVARLANDGLTALALLAVTLIYGAPWLGVTMLLYSSLFALHSYYFVLGRTVTDHWHAVINNAHFAAISISLIIGVMYAWRRRRAAAGRMAA